MQKGIEILLYSANRHAHFAQEHKNWQNHIISEIKGPFVIPFIRVILIEINAQIFSLYQCIQINNVI